MKERLGLLHFDNYEDIRVLRHLDSYEAGVAGDLANIRFNIEVRERELVQLRDRERQLHEKLAVARRLAWSSYWERLLRLISKGRL